MNRMSVSEWTQVNHITEKTISIIITTVISNIISFWCESSNISFTNIKLTAWKGIKYHGAYLWWRLISCWNFYQYSMELIQKTYKLSIAIYWGGLIHDQMPNGSTPKIMQFCKLVLLLLSYLNFWKELRKTGRKWY